MEMKMNFLYIALSSLVPLIIGFVWYNPKVFGHAWMNAAGLEESKLKEGFNMPLVFGLTLVFGFFLSFTLSAIVIHQYGFFSMLVNHMKDPQTIELYTKTMEVYGSEFRSFKHGMLHGTIAGITIALPVLGVNALFERKGFKYIAINAGFWIVCMMIMGGIICQFA